MPRTARKRRSGSDDRVSSCISHERHKGTPQKKAVAFCINAGKRKRLGSKGGYKRKKK